MSIYSVSSWTAVEAIPDPKEVIPMGPNMILIRTGDDIQKKKEETSQTISVNRYLSPTVIKDARSRNPVEDHSKGLTEAILDAQENNLSLELEPGSIYQISQPILISLPIRLFSTGNWATLNNNSTKANAASAGIATLRAAKGFSGDLLTVSPSAIGAVISGIYIDCTNQVRGNGLVILGSTAYRSNRRFFDIVIHGTSNHGIVLKSAKEDFFERVYSRDNQGHGWEILGSDLFFDKCFASKNKQSGFHWVEGSGAGRFTRCDSWDNKEYGVLLEGQNCSFLSLQCDKNELGAIRIKKATSTSQPPKRFQFIGGNSLAQGKSASDFHISDNSSNITIVGWNFGYGNSKSPAQYAINDDSPNGVCNSIIGCTFETKAYLAFMSQNVIKYWATQGHNADFGALSTASTDGQNLVMNGEFTIWETEKESYPAAWNRLSSDGSIATDITSELQNHTCVLKSNTKNSDQGIYQIIDIPPGYLKGKRATLIATANASGEGTKVLEIRDGNFATELYIPSDGITRTISASRDFRTNSECSIRIKVKSAGDGTSTGQLAISRIVLAAGSSIDTYTSNPKQYACGCGKLSPTSTPSVLGYENWEISGSTSITNFTDAYEGKNIIIIGNGRARLIHSSKIFLKNEGDEILKAGQAISLRYIKGAWREI